MDGIIITVVVCVVLVFVMKFVSSKLRKDKVRGEAEGVAKGYDEDYFEIKTGRKAIFIVNGENITFNKPLSKKTNNFLFADINHIVLSRNSLVEVYTGYSQQNKQLFYLTSAMPFYELFLNKVRARGIEILLKKRKG